MAPTGRRQHAQLSHPPDAAAGGQAGGPELRNRPPCLVQAHPSQLCSNCGLCFVSRFRHKLRLARAWSPANWLGPADFAWLGLRSRIALRGAQPCTLFVLRVVCRGVCLWQAAARTDVASFCPGPSLHFGRTALHELRPWCAWPVSCSGRHLALGNCIRQMLEQQAGGQAGPNFGMAGRLALSGPVRASFAQTAVFALYRVSSTNFAWHGRGLRPIGLARLTLLGSGVGVGFGEGIGEGVGIIKRDP